MPIRFEGHVGAPLQWANHWTHKREKGATGYDTANYDLCH
jgi:hypothetical protein